jgi:type I restriction enzyme, S subunit
MNHKPYSKYKDSGVEWLGEVPEHWEVKRLRFMIIMNPSKQEVCDIDRDTLVDFIPMDAVGEDGSLRLDSQRTISEVETGYTYFANGDVTYAKITPCFENGKGTLMAGLSEGYGFGTTELTVIRPRADQVYGSYLWFITKTQEFRKLGESWMYGAGGQKRVPDDFTRELTWTQPSLSEQKSIAAFLDRETSKLDILIREQKELITLLQEKRQALISNAVTKGLNPKAKMKDSGVEWLGEVPEHWVVKKLSYVGNLKSGDQITSDDIDEVGEYPVYGGNGFRGYTQNFTHDGYYALIGRQGALCGNINYAKGKFWASEHAVVVNPKDEFNTNWIGELLREMNLNQYSTSAAQPGLSVEIISALKIVVPPIKEQNAIASFLEYETTKLDALIKEAEETIDLMHEHRASLISEAVTGKIDVRKQA